MYSGIYIVVNKDIYERLAHVQLVKPQLRGAGCLRKTPIDAYDSLNGIYALKAMSQVCANVTGDASDSYAFHIFCAQNGSPKKEFLSSTSLQNVAAHQLSTRGSCPLLFAPSQFDLDFPHAVYSSARQRGIFSADRFAFSYCRLPWFRLTAAQTVQN